MVEEGMVLNGRGRMPIETEPLLSVDAIDGWRIQLMTGADAVLCHGIEGIPKVTVFPLEPLCELGGPGEGNVGREGLLSARFSSLGTGESRGELKGAIALGTFVACGGSDDCELCAGGFVA